MLSFTPRFGERPRLLFVGAHSDDIEIGAGAAVLELVERHPDARVLWVVWSAEGQRELEARRSAEAFLAGVEDPEVRTFDLPDARFPSQLERLKEHFEALKAFEPELIFTHAGHDMHQDHRLVSELTWNTFRGHAVLEYEVPKYDADLRSPSVFVPVSAERARRKAELLEEHFGSQRARHWFDRELFLGLMRLRGVECRSPSGYAEGFYGRKLVLG